MDAEIGVVGGGPAGARAAELLAGLGAEVVVWDPEVPWEKPCGGGLAASTFDLMPELRRLEDGAQRIDRVRFEAPCGRSTVDSDRTVGFPIHLRRPMYVVARRELARFQMDRAIAAGAGWIDEKIRSVRREERQWVLTGSAGRTWRVSRIVGADGAASRVRPAASPDLAVELAPTRVAYPVAPVDSPGILLVRLFDAVDGYFWDFSRPDHRSVGAGVEPGRWNRSRLDREIDDYLHHQPEEAAEHRCRTGAVIGTAALGHGRYEELGDESFALLGDAGGLADPATGEGIQNALRSAGYLAEAYAGGGDFTAYPRLVRAGMAREFQRSRVLRRVLFQMGWGVRLVRRGSDGVARRWARALVSAVMNCTNEHDLKVSSLVRRSATALMA